MLLKFRCDNFKAFRDGFEFNMVPEKRMTELNYSILKEQIGKRKVNALSSSVIYGPNAAGKTSIVNAMSCMRQIVLQGGMKDVSGDPADGQAISAQLIPFAFQETARPVCFDAWFTFHDVEYRYEVGIYLGKFLEKQVDPYITEESLYVNGSLIYRREENEVTELSLPSVKKFLNTGYTLEETDTTRKKMSDNLVSDSLLLTTDFNSFCSKRIVSEIVAWFKTQFMVINSSNYVRFYPSFPEKSNAVLDHTINRIAQEAGIIGSAFIYVQDAKTHSPQLMSLFQTNDQENPYGLDADQIESVGTLRLISIMPAVISVLEKGAVLVMDELDASLHPMIVMNLISIFHNDEVNTRRAQLIFNTHNPIYLSHKLLRRDEIKFVERDKETKSSNLYALSDFKANGEASVRKTSDYMKNYFINRYGAIEDIDFTDIVSDILNGELAEEGGHLMGRNESRQFNMSVEGVNCERLYFKHLAKLINGSGRNQYNLKISPKAMTPFQYAKRNAYKPVEKLPYIHIQDIEDYYDDAQRKKSYGVIDEMRKAESTFGISYRLGYSNYTFELWMLLHVADMNYGVASRVAYLQPVNQYFHRNYKSLDDFKTEAEFQGILNEFITLDAVFLAVSRAERIVKSNTAQEKIKETYRKVAFYRDNPDVTVHEVVKLIKALPPKTKDHSPPVPPFVSRLNSFS